MADTVTLSKADLDELLAKAARGGTDAAAMAAPVPTPEPDLTIGDVLRKLIRHTRFPTETEVRACEAAVDKAYPADAPDEKSDNA